MKAEKVFVIGLDGMDPSLTKKYMDAGLLPNIKKVVDAGACREDLVLLGGQPTVTPPMWTTLATGANPRTASLVFGIKTPTTWMQSFIIWIPGCVMQSNCGMSLLKLA